MNNVLARTPELPVVSIIGTTGDISRLLRQLHQLVDAGNSVVIVEHDLDTIATADWIIDLGPRGGDAGGKVVVSGPPAVVAKNKVSATAPYLDRRLALPGANGPAGSDDLRQEHTVTIVGAPLWKRRSAEVLTPVKPSTTTTNIKAMSSGLPPHAKSLHTK
jgi:hypothetical protein